MMFILYDEQGFFIPVIFTSNSLLPFSVTSIFVLCDKMDVEAWSDCQWFCERLVIFGITLLNLFHGSFFIKSFQQPRCLSEM